MGGLSQEDAITAGNCSQMLGVLGRAELAKSSLCPIVFGWPIKHLFTHTLTLFIFL